MPTPGCAEVLTKPVDRPNKAGLFLLATLLLLVFAPLIGFIAVAVRIDGAGPIFLKRTFVIDGRPVPGFVFRTGHPAGGGASQLSQFLRDSSLDQLPRLLSTLWGGMPLGIYRAHASRPVAGAKPQNDVAASDETI